MRSGEEPSGRPASSAHRTTSSARPYLAFSTQAAYAAPLILLAQTRQADRDKAHADDEERRHDEQLRLSDERLTAIRAETRKLEQLLETNTELTRQDKALTEQVAALTQQIHGLLTARGNATG